MGKTKANRRRNTGTNVIYDSDDLTNISDNILNSVDRAVVAAAFRVRDDARQSFLQGGSNYKRRTSKYAELSEGIRVKHLNNNEAVVFSTKGKDPYYKTRFFIGGTIQREQTKRRDKTGKQITLSKPFTKGRIKENNAIDNVLSHAEGYLTNYIKNVIK